MKESKKAVKERVIVRKGLASRIVVSKEGKNDELHAALAKLADNMNKDITIPPNEMRIRMW